MCEIPGILVQHNFFDRVLFEKLPKDLMLALRSEIWCFPSARFSTTFPEWPAATLWEKVHPTSSQMPTALQKRHNLWQEWGWKRRGDTNRRGGVGRRKRGEISPTHIVRMVLLDKQIAFRRYTAWKILRNTVRVPGERMIIRRIEKGFSPCSLPLWVFSLEEHVFEFEWARDSPQQS